MDNPLLFAVHSLYPTFSLVRASSISMSRIGQIGFAQTEAKVPPCLGALVWKDEYELAGLSPIALVEWTSEMRTKWVPFLLCTWSWLRTLGSYLPLFRKMKSFYPVSQNRLSKRWKTVSKKELFWVEVWRQNPIRLGTFDWNFFAIGILAIQRIEHGWPCYWDLAQIG